MKQIYFSVTNDLICDQRVDRIINSLIKSGVNCHLIGRKLKISTLVTKRGYDTYRFNMFFKKGFLFYFFYNFRLFIFLLTRKKIDILVSNDLDTLPANFLVSKIRNVHLVYDSHEYFTEVPELINRRFVKNFWLFLEKLFVPKLKHAYTVSRSIADEYFIKYKVRFKVVRNFPAYSKNQSSINFPFNAENKKILIYQGSVNIGRGLELIIETIQELEGIIFLVVGDGDIKHKLEERVRSQNLSEKIYFLGKIPFESLHYLTCQCDAGVSFEEDMGLNYRYSLPNKLFDYIGAYIPVLVSALPEMTEIVNNYDIGIVGNKRDVESVKQNIMELMFDENKRAIWKKNLVKAAKELSWENEEKVLNEIYSPLIFNKINK